MGYVIRAGPAVAACGFAAATGFDRERVFYPAIVTATYYVLFAVMGNSMVALGWESLVASAVSGRRAVCAQ